MEQEMEYIVKYREDKHSPVWSQNIRFRSRETCDEWIRSMQESNPKFVVDEITPQPVHLTRKGKYIPSDPKVRLAMMGDIAQYGKNFVKENL